MVIRNVHARAAFADQFRGARFGDLSATRDRQHCGVAISNAKLLLPFLLANLDGFVSLLLRNSLLKARPTPSAPGPGLRSSTFLLPHPQGRPRQVTWTASFRGLARWRVLSVLGLLAILCVACGGGGEPATEEDDGIQVGAAQVDFNATGVTATPNELRQIDLITIDATIHNTGVEPSGDFVVRAFLKRGTNCNDTSFYLDAQTLSIGPGASAAFQVTRVIDNSTLR